MGTHIISAPEQSAPLCSGLVITRIVKLVEYFVVLFFIQERKSKKHLCMFLYADIYFANNILLYFGEKYISNKIAYHQACLLAVMMRWWKWKPEFTVELVAHMQNLHQQHTTSLSSSCSANQAKSLQQYTST